MYTGGLVETFLSLDAPLFAYDGACIGRLEAREGPRLYWFVIYCDRYFVIKLEISFQLNFL